MAAAVHAQVGIRQFGGCGGLAVPLAEEEYKLVIITVEHHSGEFVTLNPVKVHGGR